MKAITRPTIVQGKATHIAVIIASPEEAQTLLNAIDALHRETAQDYREIRAELVTAAYRRIH